MTLASDSARMDQVTIAQKDASPQSTSNCKENYFDLVWLKEIGSITYLSFLQHCQDINRSVVWFNGNNKKTAAINLSSFHISPFLIIITYIQMSKKNPPPAPISHEVYIYITAQKCSSWNSLASNQYPANISWNCIEICGKKSRHWTTWYHLRRRKFMADQCFLCYKWLSKRLGNEIFPELFGSSLLNCSHIWIISFSLILPISLSL